MPWISIAGDPQTAAAIWTTRVALGTAVGLPQHTAVQGFAAKAFTCITAQTANEAVSPSPSAALERTTFAAALITTFGSTHCLAWRAGPTRVKGALSNRGAELTGCAAPPLAVHDTGITGDAALGLRVAELPRGGAALAERVEAIILATTRHDSAGTADALAGVTDLVFGAAGRGRSTTFVAIETAAPVGGTADELTRRSASAWSRNPFLGSFSAQTHRAAVPLALLAVEATTDPAPRVLPVNELVAEVEARILALRPGQAVAQGVEQRAGDERADPTQRVAARDGPGQPDRERVEAGVH